MHRFVVCTSKHLGDASGDDLTIGMVYEVASEERGMFRLADDSGERYSYPCGCFEAVSLSEQGAKRLHAVLTSRFRGGRRRPGQV